MELRAKPNNVFQKDFFKLMNDSVSADLAGVVVTRFDTSNYAVERLPPGPFQFSNLLQLVNNQSCQLSSVSFFLKA